MTTPSQSAFKEALKNKPEAKMWNSHDLMLWAWNKGEAHGRKQALEAVRKDAAWQPIETAPKDGTAILAIVSGVDSDGLAYEPSTVQIDGTQVHLFCDSDDDSWTELSEWELTHWMPLPKPPIAIKELLK